MRDWLADDREVLRIHRELTEATHAWEAIDRDRDALYRGARLTRAEAWAAGQDASLTPRERGFLHASQSARTRGHLTSVRRVCRLRRLVALLAILLVATSAATAYAVRAQHLASKQHTTALAHQALREAAEIRAVNPGLAARLLLTAYRLDSSVFDTNGQLHLTIGNDKTEPSWEITEITTRPDGHTRVFFRESANRFWAVDIDRFAVHYYEAASTRISNPDVGCYRPIHCSR